MVEGTEFAEPVVPESGGDAEVAFEAFLLHPVQFVFFEAGEELDDAVWVETFNNEARFAGSVACVEGFVPLLFDVVVDAFDEEVHGGVFFVMQGCEPLIRRRIVQPGSRLVAGLLQSMRCWMRRRSLFRPIHGQSMSGQW